jgi:hypothetical protein
VGRGWSVDYALKLTHDINGTWRTLSPSNTIVFIEEFAILRAPFKPAYQSTGVSKSSAGRFFIGWNPKEHDRRRRQAIALGVGGSDRKW